MTIKKLLQSIFFIKTEGIHKVFCIFGIKFKFLSSSAVLKQSKINLDNINSKLNDLDSAITNDIKNKLNNLEHIVMDNLNAKISIHSDYLLNTLGLVQSINHRDIYNTQGILNEILNNQIRLNKHFLNINNNIRLETNYPVAEDSNDNLFPESTMDGVIGKPRFINKIIQIFGVNASLLDIGCGGGGIVFSAIEQGLIAFGIDGSAQNKKFQNGYWQILPNNLLTCDATKPFSFIQNDENKFKFSVISSWECLEHIPEAEVKNFLDNVYNNLDDQGYFIGSISRMPYANDETGVVYHVTLKDKEWWSKKFNEANLELLKIEDSLFEFSDFCRGIGIGWQDIHTNYLENKEDGILFVAKKKK